MPGYQRQTDALPPDVVLPSEPAFFAAFLLSLCVATLAGCSRSASPESHAKDVFVRSGFVVASTGQGPASPVPRVNADDPKIGDSAEPQVVKPFELAPGRTLLTFNWEPATSYDVECDGVRQFVTAPLKPTPYPLWKILLEDVRAAAAGGTWPDCVVAFSPDSTQLAIGSFEGWIRVADVFSGRMLWSERLAEGMVKEIAWSPDGARLYVGEQSPDGRLLAFDLGKHGSRGREKLSPPMAWSVHLADDLETSRPPAHDRFGIYTLPAAYDLHVARDGRLFVAGTHRWPSDGGLQSRSLVACFDVDGKRLWQFPAEKPTATTPGVTFIAIDAAGDRVAFLSTLSDSTPSLSAATPALASQTTFVVLDGHSGRKLGEIPIEPLEPHFARVESWDSVSVNDDGSRAVLGLSDGRALLFSLEGESVRLLREIPLATPALIGETPIAASASYARFHGPWLCLQTQNTHIPWGSPQAANRPPLAHPGANTLTVCDRDGNAQWLYHGPYSLSGSWTDRPQTGPPRWLAVASREQPGAAEPGNFGLLLFDLTQTGGGNERLVYYYPTAGPAMFSAGISPDGRRLAVAETPTPTPDGRDLYGTYQVHIFH